MLHLLPPPRVDVDQSAFRPKLYRRVHEAELGLKACFFISLLAAGLAGCAGGPAVQDANRPAALEAARTRAEHEEIAARYEREAGIAEDRTAAHRRMLALYASPYPDYGSGAGFIRHCRSMVQRYGEAAEANRALATAHRAAAAGSAE